MTPPPAYQAYLLQRQAEMHAVGGSPRSHRRAALGAYADEVSAAVDEHSSSLVALSRAIHEHPEVGFEEFFAARSVRDYLDQRGHEVESGLWSLPTSFRASVGSGGPAIALVAEYDALPGIGHGCGHNVICAAAVGAFLAAAPLVERTGGRLVLIGAPAEEGGGGKEIIARAGGFDEIDAAVMVHPAGFDTAQATFVGLRQVRVTYRGLAAHASASPYMGLNALDGLVSAYQAIAQLRQHVLPTDRLHGIVTAGGEAPNIVPDHAQGVFYLRSASIDTLQALTERVNAVFEGAALMTGTRVDVEWDFRPMMLPVRNNSALAQRYAENMVDRGRFVPIDAEVPSGSTDMGNVSVRIPSIHPKIALAPADVPIHSEAFADYAGSDSGDRAVLDGAVALARTALDFLSDRKLREQVKEEFALAGGRVDVPSLDWVPSAGRTDDVTGRGGNE